MTDCHQLEEGWIENKGNIPKLPEKTLIKIRRRDFLEKYCNLCLEEIYWKISCSSHDIMAYKIIAPASEKWIAWNGGKCPVNPNTPVYFRLRNGLVFPPSPAGILPWKNKNDEHDIIAYTVAEIEQPDLEETNCVEKPEFKIIDEKTFSFGKRKFVLNKEVTNMFLKDNKICLECGTEDKIPYSNYTICCIDPKFKPIHDLYFTEITEEQPELEEKDWYNFPEQISGQQVIQVLKGVVQGDFNYFVLDGVMYELTVKKIK